MPGTRVGGASRAVGYDVSYPQCGTALPDAQAFAVVGVNGGLSTRRPTPASPTQLTWAWESNGAVPDAAARRSST